MYSLYRIKKKVLFVVLSVFIPIFLNANLASVFAQNYKSILSQAKYALAACKVNGGENCSRFFTTLISSPELYSYKLVYITDIDSNEVIKAEIIYKTGEEDLALVSLSPWSTSSVLFNISYLTDSTILINNMINNVDTVITDYIAKVNTVMKDVVFDVPAASSQALTITTGNQIVHRNDFMEWTEAKNIKAIKSQLKNFNEIKSTNILNVAMKKKAKDALEKMSKQHWKSNPLSKMVYKVTYNKSSGIPRKFQTPSKIGANIGTNTRAIKYLTKASFFTNVGSWTSALVAAGLDISAGVKAGNDYIIARGGLNAALFAIDLSSFLATSLGFSAAASVLNPISLGATVLSIPIIMSIHEMERNHNLLQAFTDFANSKSYKDFANTIKETNSYSSIWAPLSIADSTSWYSEYITSNYSRGVLNNYIIQWQNKYNVDRFPYQNVDDLKGFINSIRRKGAGPWYAINKGKTYFPLSKFPTTSPKGIFFMAGMSCESVEGTGYNDFIGTGTLSTEGCEVESDAIFANAGDDTILLGEGNHGEFWQGKNSNINGGSGNDTLVLDGMSDGENGEKRAFYVNLLENNASWVNIKKWCNAYVYYDSGNFKRRIATTVSEMDRNDECVNNYFLPFVEVNDETDTPFCPNENLCKDISSMGNPPFRLISAKGNMLGYQYPASGYPFQEQIYEDTNAFNVGKVKNIENVIGTSIKDKIIGDDNANFINGNGGDDIIYTLGGNDEVDASNGDTKLKVFLGDGDDSIDINEGFVDPGKGDDIIKTVSDGYATKQIRISGSSGDDIYNLGSARTVFGDILKRDGNTHPILDRGRDTIAIEYELLGFPSFMNGWYSLRQSSSVLGFYWENPYYDCQGVLSQCYDLQSPSNYQPSFYATKENMEVLAISFVETMCNIAFPDDLGLSDSDKLSNVCVEDEESYTSTHIIEPNVTEPPVDIVEVESLPSLSSNVKNVNTDSSEPMFLFEKLKPSKTDPTTATTIFSIASGNGINLRSVDQGDIILGLRSDFEIGENKSFKIDSSIYKKSLIFLPKSNTYRYNNENSQLITNFSEVDFEITTGGFDDIVFAGLAKKNIVYTNSGNDKIIANDTNSPLVVYSGDGDDYIIGSKSNDFIKAENGNDIIRANDGNDYILGGEGVNKIYGGLGDDIYDMTNSVNSIIFDSFGSNYITCVDILDLRFTEQSATSKYAKLESGGQVIYFYDLANSDSSFYLKGCDSNEFTYKISKDGLSSNIDSTVLVEFNNIANEFTSYINKDTSSNNFRPEVNIEEVDTLVNMRGLITPINRPSLFSTPTEEEINSPVVGRNVVLSDSSLSLDNLKYITVESCCSGTMLEETVTIEVPENFSQTNQELWIKFYEDVDIRGVKVKIEISEDSYGKKIRVVPLEGRYYTGNLEDYDFNSPINGIDFNPIQLIPANISGQRGYGIKNVKLHFATGKFYLEDKFLKYNQFVSASGIRINKTDDIQTIANLRAIRARGHQEDGTSYINENFYTMAPVSDDFRSGDELWFKYYVYGISGSKYVKGIKVRIDEYDDRFELTPIKGSYMVLDDSLINDVKAQSTDGEFDPYSSLIDLETQPSYSLARSITSSGYGMKEVTMVFTDSE